MTETVIAENQRSYGCTFGCGNPYDMIVITVSDGTTQFLCVPCFIRTASDALSALLDIKSPGVQEAIAHQLASGLPSVPGPSGKRGKRNAPATSSDAALIEAYSDVMDADALPPEFR